ncbi:hypothetical protein AVDCRST_MAG94-847, partial [uncultured Leptolyngbya sp.]
MSVELETRSSAMQRMKVRQRVAADGILHLEISTGIPKSEVEVTVTYQKLAPQEVDERGWPVGFFERTCGICAE